MPSKSVGSPLAAIFQQWTSQQLQLQQDQQPQIEEERQVPSSDTPVSSPVADHYTILLQTSFSLTDRIRAAEPVENPHVYQHAGVRTPAEAAIRNGQGGPAWLLRLLELAARQQHHQPPPLNICGVEPNHRTSATSRSNHNNTILDDEDSTKGVAVCWVATRTVQPSPMECLPENARNRIHVLDLASGNPWGWDDDDDDDEDRTSSRCSMKSLPRLLRRLRHKLCSMQRPVILVWQSLMPLVVVHGFETTLRFLRRLTAVTTASKDGPHHPILPPCLQVWPIDTEGLTSQQHAQLEDLSHALLFLRGGDITMMRQGVRERGNLLRSTLPFQLSIQITPSSSSSMFSGHMYYRVEEGSDEKEKKGGEETAVAATGAAMTSLAIDDGRKSNRANDTNFGNEASGRSRVRLRLEEEDEEKETKPQRHHQQQQQTQQRPRIYLQDDDPEFADLDEEDPDEDLDI